LVPQNLANAAPTIPPYLYISAEVGGGNNATLRNLVDAQDDIWRADASAAGATSFAMVDFRREADDGLPDIRPDTPGPYPPGDPITNPLTLPDGTYFEFPTAGDVLLTITLMNMDGTGPYGGSSAGMTATWPRLARSTTLQDGAPRPNSLYTTSSSTRPRMWNEAIGSGLNRNAVLFQFSEPVAAFGAWFGDVETRTDGGGTPARVQLFDDTNSLIEDQVIPTSTADQSECGAPVNDGFTGCGNETTRWIGFIDTDVSVSAMLVIVGDDDTTGDDQGFGESISFIGATLAEGIVAPEPEPDPAPKPEELPDTGFKPGAYTRRERGKMIAFSPSDGIRLQIPSLGVNADVVGVPLTNSRWEVEWLGDDVGYLEGTAYPTWIGNSVLTGHVYDHQGHPGVFSGLSTLSYGQRVVISAWGQDYIYEVRESRQAPADEISLLSDTGDGYDWLTLITCKGYDEQLDEYRWRHVVRAVLVKVR